MAEKADKPSDAKPAKAKEPKAVDAKAPKAKAADAKISGAGGGEKKPDPKSDVSPADEKKKSGKQDLNTQRTSGSAVNAVLEKEQARLRKAAIMQIYEEAGIESTAIVADDGRLKELAATDPLKLGSISEYVRLPKKGDTNDANRWRIELHDIAPGQKPVGIDVVGDVVMGRGKLADLNLEDHGVDADSGVSRMHSMLRPTASGLYLFDLDSTNGVKANAMPLGKGQAYVLRDNDIISLGMINFTVRLIDGPALRKKKEEGGLGGILGNLFGGGSKGNDPQP